MAFIVPAIVGIGALISGAIGGYMLAPKAEATKVTTDENGIINNNVKIEDTDHTELTWLLRITVILQSIILLVIFFNKVQNYMKKKYTARVPQVNTSATSSV